MLLAVPSKAVKNIKAVIMRQMFFIHAKGFYVQIEFIGWGWYYTMHCASELEIDGTSGIIGGGRRRDSLKAHV